MTTATCELSSLLANAQEVPLDKYLRVGRRGGIARLDIKLARHRAFVEWVNPWDMRESVATLSSRSRDTLKSTLMLLKHCDIHRQRTSLSFGVEGVRTATPTSSRSTLQFSGPVRWPGLMSYSIPSSGTCYSCGLSGNADCRSRKCLSSRQPDGLWKPRPAS